MRHRENFKVEFQDLNYKTLIWVGTGTERVRRSVRSKAVLRNELVFLTSPVINDPLLSQSFSKFRCRRFCHSRITKWSDHFHHHYTLQFIIRLALIFITPTFNNNYDGKIPLLLLVSIKLILFLSARTTLAITIC